MDKTSRYAEMSEKAIELQAQWEPRDNDWFAIKRDLLAGGGSYALKGEVYQAAYVLLGRIHFMRYSKGAREPEKQCYHLQYLRRPKNFKLTWLLTQSQLQDKLKERTRENQKYNRAYVEDEYLEGFSLRYVLKDFLHWVEKEGIDHLFTSLEQFWLAFYMREVYKKNWDHEKREWVYLTKRERVGYFPTKRERLGYFPLTV